LRLGSRVLFLFFEQVKQIQNRRYFAVAENRRAEQFCPVMIGAPSGLMTISSGLMMRSI
jgi:hypothetical protein